MSESHQSAPRPDEPHEGLDDGDLPLPGAPALDSETLAQLEAEHAGRGGAPTELLLLLAAPLLLILLPLLLWLMLRAAPQTPLARNATPAAAVAPGQGIKQTAIAWQTSLSDAQALARQSGKNLMVDFYADW